MKAATVASLSLLSLLGACSSPRQQVRAEGGDTWVERLPQVDAAEFRRRCPGLASLEADGRWPFQRGATASVAGFIEGHRPGVDTVHVIVEQMRPMKDGVLQAEPTRAVLQRLVYRNPCFAFEVPAGASFTLRMWRASTLGERVWVGRTPVRTVLRLTE